MAALLTRFLREDEGQDLIEYGVIIGLITAAAVAAIGLIAPKTQTYYQSLCTAIGVAGC